MEDKHKLAMEYIKKEDGSIVIMEQVEVSDNIDNMIARKTALEDTVKRLQEEIEELTTTIEQIEKL